MKRRQLTKAAIAASPMRATKVGTKNGRTPKGFKANPSQLASIGAEFQLARLGPRFGGPQGGRPNIKQASMGPAPKRRGKPQRKLKATKDQSWAPYRYLNS
jgi:hypothetical protein